MTQETESGWQQAAVAWEVCASVHRRFAKGRDPLFDTRQSDFIRHANDARAKAAAAVPPYTCKYCGGPTWIDPADQSPPPDQCHDEDHGEPE